MIRVRLLVRPSLRRVGALLLPNWLAITVGRTIVSWRRLDPPELAHELEHVRQWRRYGPVGFVLRYVAASLRTWLTGGDWYRDNGFEQAAREAALAERVAWRDPGAEGQDPPSTPSGADAHRAGSIGTSRPVRR